MLTLRKSQDRGFADHGWLKTYHSFSFNNYVDRNHVRHGPLRVLNEDFIAAGTGFPSHPHENMEIVTYVLSGAVAHQDSSGGKAIIRAGEVQRMSAGRGIVHSEYNASDEVPVHLLQIWFYPNRKDIEPGYEQKEIFDATDELITVVSPEPSGQQLKIHQDVYFKIANLATGKTIETSIDDGRSGYLHNSMSGTIKIRDQFNNHGNEIVLEPGDALKLLGPINLHIESIDKEAKPGRFVLLDMISV